LRQLRRLRENVSHREAVANAYRSRLAELGFEAPRDVHGQCPNAESAARHLVNLPTHLRVGEADVDAITSALGAR
jgi:dTDP-4-amino-4,6-dideoxygalactose transaminase